MDKSIDDRGRAAPRARRDEGAYPLCATFTVPSRPPGTYTVTAVDAKSQYPVQQSFQIQ
jgi:hypothetical protein